MESEIFEAVPSTDISCPHGPMLLFKRVCNGEERSFFACSTCRNRKDCHFFHWADEKMSAAKLKAWELIRERMIPKLNHKELHHKFLQVKKASSDKRAFCHTCNCLLQKNEASKEHSGHNLKIGISDRHLKHPSELLEPLVNSKKEAQYLFSSGTTRSIANMMLSLGVKRVLCVCAPRVHEYISSEKSLGMTSLLLDIDHRYHYFYSSRGFCWFNAFNNHFFSAEEGPCTLRTFLETGNEAVGLVMDPPFGGRVEPLAKTVHEIVKLGRQLCPHVKQDITVFWIFPYFMEPQILASCPGFSMLDYKVNYENHSSFVSGPKGRKFGSPVRIFTNARPEDVIFPADEGYKYCDICQRWVSEENKHCKLCDKCTSKNGQTYVHCNSCKRCVKPSWRHCTVCDRCCLSSHVCGEFVPSDTCFNCGKTGHKKQDCPSFSCDSAIFVTLDSGSTHTGSKKRQIKSKSVKNSKKLRVGKKMLSSKQKRLHKTMAALKRKRKNSKMGCDKPK